MTTPNFTPCSRLAWTVWWDLPSARSLSRTYRKPSWVVSKSRPHPRPRGYLFSPPRSQNRGLDSVSTNRKHCLVSHTKCSIFPDVFLSSPVSYVTQTYTHTHTLDTCYLYSSLLSDKLYTRINLHLCKEMLRQWFHFFFFILIYSMLLIRLTIPASSVSRSLMLAVSSSQVASRTFSPTR